MALIEFRNVSKVYNNGTEALHNINLTVDKGEFVFIVGSSGAGKSTFLKLVMCEERPNSGQIIGGFRPLHPQTCALYPKPGRVAA